MTHVDNIPHILQHGITHRNSINANPNYISIGDGSLIDNRSSTNINVTNGSENVSESITIGDFIPFYFGIRTPMLYIIQNGYKGVKRQNPDDIIYCVTSVQQIIISNNLFYFTDGHANSKKGFTLIYDDKKINEIESLIDFKAAYNKNWKDDTDLDLKRRKEAEFLVKNDVPNNSILGYICFSDVSKNKLIKMEIEETKIVVKPNYYF
ncbi:DUF4433 domain-containing protein [Flavobacterium azooxidireducens]|uniref:DUF4433 domain-containing protein n=1 Tax=Flavobacterium azooxidireducens TaxID=1871076 RepID=A0ABY4KI96_9FLAO|nr:DUF4433 domain-containing protein [Flavobacterium azooxidireducens]UPQ80544.1 DUF4433 domain-containing protein [Flavobacterium azooxidireducens]